METQEAKMVSDTLLVTVSNKGAELQSIRELSGHEFLWQADQKIWPRRAPVLFPIVGKLKNDKYSFNGKNYPLGQHGFARDQHFLLTESKHDSCSFVLESDGNAYPNFPFPFTLTIRYELSDSKLTTIYQVRNIGNEALHFSIGAHPGFFCTLRKDARFEDHYLKFPAEEYAITLLSDGLRELQKTKLTIPNGKLKLSTTLFEKDALVFENSQISKIELACEGTTRRIEMNCQDWPYFGIWSKKGNDQFVCLEPWYGVADSIDGNNSLEHKEGILRLEPAGTFNARFAVIFHG